MEQRWCGRQARGTRRDTRAVVRINLITQRRNEIFAPWTNVALWRVHVQFILHRRRLLECHASFHAPAARTNAAPSFSNLCRRTGI